MHPRYRAILRSVFAGIVQSGLSPADLRVLSSEFRKGQMADELAHMLDQVSPHFRDSERSDQASDELKVAERWIKEKRISKLDLINIIMSIFPEAVEQVSGLTVKGTLKLFFDTASSRQIDRLMNILQAAGGADPYLKGITER